MKSFSIKTRLMFWYAFVMILIVMLSVLMLLITGDRLTRDGAKSNLTVTTDRAIGDIRINEGKLNIDDDMVYYSNGAYVVIYMDDGTPLSGLELEEFPENVKFEEDKIREVDGESKSFYVYDRLIENKKVGKIWVRGMASADIEEISPAIARMIMMFLIALPIMLILALLGGYFASKRAFAPLKEINETAQKIHDGSDLSLRIGIPQEGKGDEITETARLFDEMLDSVEKNFEAEKRFTDDASHELRTPTAVILTQSEYALGNLDNKAEVEQALRIILGQSHKMTDLLDKLLMLARADNGRVKLSRDLVDLGLVLELSAASHEREAQSKNIDISVNVAREISLIADMALIERAVDNLLSNAIKYGRQDGHVSMMLSEDMAGNAIIDVSDDGIGIPAEDINHIWDRFYRANGAGDHEGMGLGLALTKWIVQAHGGEISAVSEVGKGSTFRITLPIKREEE